VFIQGGVVGALRVAVASLDFTAGVLLFFVDNVFAGFADMRDTFADVNRVK